MAQNMPSERQRMSHRKEMGVVENPSKLHPEDKEGYVNDARDTLP